MSNLYKSAAIINQGISSSNDFEIFYDGDPRKGIPAVTWALKPTFKNYSLYDLSDHLRMRG